MSMNILLLPVMLC